ncbi:MAG: hypothetical protein ABSH20_31650 [Tepidisphaeraceae bacterium]
MSELLPIPAPGCLQCAILARMVLELQTQVKALQAEVRDRKARLNTQYGSL